MKHRAAMAKRIVWTGQAKSDLCGIDHRVFFRDKGDYLEVSRVLDRKEAYR